MILYKETNSKEAVWLANTKADIGKFGKVMKVLAIILILQIASIRI